MGKESKEQGQSKSPKRFGVKSIMTSLLPFSIYKRGMNFIIDKVLAIGLMITFCVLGALLIFIGFALNDYKQALIGLAFFHMGIAILAVQFKKRKEKKLAKERAEKEAIG